MSTRTSRRVPWPWDMRIARAVVTEPALLIGDTRHHLVSEYRGIQIGSMRGQSNPIGQTQGLMLLPQPDGALMVAKKQIHLENLYPSVAEYDSAPVYRERTFQFRPTGGLGEPTQASANSRRYHYGINVWVVGGLFGKGPLAHDIPLTGGTPPAPDGTGMHRVWAEGPTAADPTRSTLYFISRRAVYRRDGDDSGTNAAIRTRAGHYPIDLARFTGSHTAAKDCLYVTWEDGVLEEFDGVNWTTCVLPTDFHASFLFTLVDELWAAAYGSTQVRWVNADPKVAANWSGPIFIGNPSVPVTGLSASSSRLAVFKADGSVFTLNADGSTNDLFPGLRVTQELDNGRTAVPWMGRLWFRSGRAFYELDLQGGANLFPRGPGRNLGNISEVRGPVQAFAGWNTQMAFAAIYNESLGHSYLLSYGSWVPRADPANTSTTVSGTAYQFIDQYDGALVKWPGRKVTSLFVSNVPSEARLYVGFADGNYCWIKLVPYPLVMGQEGEYTQQESYVVLPLHHAMFQSDNKHFTGLSTFGPRIGAGNSIGFRYRVMGPSVGTGLRPNGDWILWSSVEVTHNGERINPDRPVAGRALELRVDLDNSTTDTTPVLEGVGLHERLVPSFRRDYTMTVNANELIARRDGASTRQSGSTIRRWMEEAASAPASITIELPDERLSEVAIFSYEEHQAPHDQRGGLGMAITIQATEFQVVEIYGTIGRTRGTRIGDTRGLMISDMRYF